MTNFFLILMGFFIVISNIIGFIVYKKKKNLYFAAFTILLLAVLFGVIGGALAIFIIRDPFAIFYGMQLGQYLIANSVIVFIMAILVTVIKKYSSKMV
ncbi:MAG: 3-isopropylmalate dehydrogenase [Solibacillus sp.]